MENKWNKKENDENQIIWTMVIKPPKDLIIHIVFS
jgi:hypothetical protein